VDCLAHLLPPLPRRLLLIWDRAKPQRSHLVAELVAGQPGRLALDYLPAYAPALNPVAYSWGYWKHQARPNFGPQDFTSSHARSTLPPMCRRPMLLMAFRQQANLFPL
jgi:hypothetical protein